MLSVLGTLTAGGALTAGTGAFSSIQADRDIKINVTGDANAYLRLGPCTDENGNPTPNGDYVVQRNGQFAIDLTDDNGQVLGGGVNAESLSTFDNVFEVCNQGTQPVCVDFRTNSEPIPEGTTVPTYSDAEPGDPSVVFYEGDDESARIDVDELDVGRAGAFHLEVGECQCVGFAVRTFGFEEGDDLFANSGITFRAEAGAECKGDTGDDGDNGDDEPDDGPNVRDDLKGISFVTFGTGTNSSPGGVSINETLAVNDDGEPVELAWSADGPIEEVVVKAGLQWFRFDVGGETSGTVIADQSDGRVNAFKEVDNQKDSFTFPDESSSDYERCPDSPLLGIEGTKIEYDNGFNNSEVTKTFCTQPNT